MGRTIRLGAFIVGALTVLAIGVFLIGKEKFLFTSTYHLNSSFDTVIGLKEGAAVRVGGVHKGVVEQILLPTAPDGKVTVVLELDNSTHKIIKQDSVSSIQTEGLLGDKFLSVSFGSPGAPDVGDGDTIGSQPPMDVSDLIKKADEILASTHSTVDNANRAVSNFRSIGSKIDAGKGTVGALINDRKLYEQAAATTAEAKAGMTDLQENMQALKHNWFLRGFFKDRGYTDSKDLTKNEIPHLPDGPVTKRFEFDTGQVFEKPETAKLKDKGVLDQAGKFLEANKFGLAVVVASTGEKGDAAENLVLSQARAMVVRGYLVRKFRMEDTLVKTRGLGEEPRSEPNSAGKVEIVVYPTGVEVASAKTSGPAGAENQ